MQQIKEEGKGKRKTVKRVRNEEAHITSGGVRV